MIAVIKKSVSSIFSKELIKTSLMCLLTTAVVLGVFVGGANIATSTTELVSYGWIESILDFLLSAGAVLIAWLLFPVITPVIASFFVDSVTEKIEKKYYPGVLSRTSHSVSTTVIEAVKFVMVMVALNIVCLPLYLIPVINIFVYYLLNSYLISREFFDMAAAFYVSPQESKKLRKSNRGSVMGLGLVIVIINTIPVLNLFGPIIAITLMVHLFFGLYNKSKQGAG